MARTMGRQSSSRGSRPPASSIPSPGQTNQVRQVEKSRWATTWWFTSQGASAPQPTAAPRNMLNAARRPIMIPVDMTRGLQLMPNETPFSDSPPTVSPNSVISGMIWGARRGTR